MAARQPAASFIGSCLDFVSSEYCLQLQVPNKAEVFRNQVPVSMAVHCTCSSVLYGPPSQSTRTPSLLSHSLIDLSVNTGLLDMKYISLFLLEC